MKRYITGTAAFLLLFFCLAACKVVRVEEERQETAYTIVKPGDFPEEIDQILHEKKEEDFQMVYETEGDLYLLRGYGKQKSGGYSIQIEEVSKGEHTLYVRTKLMGPAQLQDQKGAVSCPYIVLKTKAEKGIAVVFEG